MMPESHVVPGSAPVQAGQAAQLTDAMCCLLLADWRWQCMALQLPQSLLARSAPPAQQAKMHRDMI